MVDQISLERAAVGELPTGWPARTKLRVIVEVSGGIAEVTTCPDGVEVEIIDHDNLEDEDPEDVTLPGDFEDGPACPECDEVLELDMEGTCCSCGYKPPRCQHRDTGRGVCADCGAAL